MAKKYKLKCFGCGSQFYKKEDAERFEGKPYCDGCMFGIYQGQAERERYEEGPSDQEMIDAANIARYGEC